MGIMDNEMDDQIVTKHIIQKLSKEAAISKSLARFQNPNDHAKSLNTVAVRPTCWVIIAETKKQDARTFIVSAEETEMFEVRKAYTGNNSANATLLKKQHLVFRKSSYHFDKDMNNQVNSTLNTARAKMQAKRAVHLANVPAMMPAIRPVMGPLVSTMVAPKVMDYARAAMKAC